MWVPPGGGGNMEAENKRRRGRGGALPQLTLALRGSCTETVAHQVVEKLMAQQLIALKRSMSGNLHRSSRDLVTDGQANTHTRVHARLPPALTHSHLPPLRFTRSHLRSRHLSRFLSRLQLLFLF